jgi:hypothetical protein
MKQLLVHVCLLFGLAASKPCDTGRTQLLQPFTVSTAAEASQLIAAVDCEGGKFIANWLGAISLPETIVIGNGTELTLTGAANATSIIEGSNTTQLFDVFGKLRLTNMTMMEAYSLQYGPAIHGHTGSTVTVTGCTISNGVGARYGALYTSGLFLLKDSILQFNSVKDASEGPAVLADYYYGKSTYNRMAVDVIANLPFCSYIHNATLQLLSVSRRSCLHCPLHACERFAAISCGH